MALDRADVVKVRAYVSLPASTAVPENGSLEASSVSEPQGGVPGEATWYGRTHS